MIVATATPGASCATTTVRLGPEGVNRSIWMRSSATPNAASTPGNSSSIASGPHKKAWSIAAASTSPGSNARSFAPSNRPFSAGTSCASRDKV